MYLYAYGREVKTQGKIKYMGGWGSSPLQKVEIRIPHLNALLSKKINSVQSAISF